MVLWGVPGVVKFVAVCPCCGARQAGIRHLLVECSATSWLRQRFAVGVDDVLSWALTGCSDVEELRKRVKFVGLGLAEMVAAHSRGVQA